MNKVIACLVALSLTMIGCKPKVPSRYIQEKDMAKILYDYHLADAMSHESSKGTKEWYEYQAYVLKKHGITKAEYDSSMAYYFRHSDKLQAIYENVTERLSREAEANGLAISDMNNYGGASGIGDTTNVWKDANAYILSQKKPFNMRYFNIDCDSTYHPGDKMVFSFDTDFIVQEGMREGVAVVAMEYGNDSVASNVIHIFSSTHYTMRLDDSDSLGIKKIHGLIMLNGTLESQSKTSLHLLSVSNIRLVRIHEKDKSSPAE